MSKKEQLKEQLEFANVILGLIKDTNIKHYEIVYQYIIERVYIGDPWWKSTKCNIFIDLIQHQDMDHTVNKILTSLNN